MKKLISLFLSLIMIVSIVAVGVVTTNAATTKKFTENGISWTVTESYPGWAIKPTNRKVVTGDVIIPQTYDNKVIFAIDDYAFSGCSGITSITIPGSILHIGDGAFNSCSGLQNINIPNTVKHIGSHAFERCVFEEIVLPDSLEEVTCVANCVSLKSFNIPKNAKIVDIPGCNSLVTLNVPDGVERFSCSYCKGLETVNLPDSVKFVDCRQCIKLKEIVIPGSVTEIYEGTFSGCTDLSTVTISNGILKIGRSAFNNCTSLSQVNIADSIETMEASFVGCTSLTSISIPDSVKSINKYTFQDCINLRNISLPSAFSIQYYKGYPLINSAQPRTEVFEENGVEWKVTYTDEGLSIGPKRPASKPIPENGIVVFPSEYNGEPIVAVSDGAFSGYDDLKEVVLPDTIKRIGDGAFACYLEKWNVPASLEYIGNAAFNTANIEDFDIPQTVKYIGDDAFCSCHNLTNVTIPSSVEYLGEGAYSNCWGLKTVYLPDTMNEINNGMFADSKNLEEVFIPNSVTKIGNSVFWGCTKLETINSLDSIKYIGYGAFRYCYLLDIEIPEGIEYIDSYAFEGCTKVGQNGLVFPNSLNYVGNYAFTNISNISSLTIDTSKLSCIGVLAFYNSSINSFSLGDNVKVIDTPLLSSNKNIERLDIGTSSIEVTYQHAFYGDDNLTVYAPVRAVTTGLRKATKFADVPLVVTNGIIESGDSKDSIVTLTTDPAIFKVTVPTVLPFTVDSDSNVTVANNAQVINNSNGQVKVTGVTAQTTEGWSIVANGTDFREVPVDSKQFTFTLNGDNFAAGNNVPLTLGSAWTVIDGKASMNLPYNGTFAVQSQPKVKLPIANTIFTIAWNKAD